MERCAAAVASPDAGTGETRASFEGFDPPESNFWRLPNNWFDLVAGFTSWAEHKVVEYVLRHTWGYHEYGISKLITMDEFMHGRKRRDGSRMDAGCGMAENSIKKGITDAVAHGFLIVEVDDRDRGRIRKFYAPRMRRSAMDDGVHALPVRDQALTPEGQSLTPHPQPLTLQPQGMTRTLQALTPSPSFSDPRTGQQPARNTPQQHTRKHNMLALPAVQPASPRLNVESESPAHLSLATEAETMDSDLRRDLLDRLVREGIAAGRARSLVLNVPTERIERQLAWIDGRRFRNRAATLIRAIEDDFAAPPSHRPGNGVPSPFDPSKFYRGTYAVCPACGARPCAPDCRGAHAPAR